MDKELLDYIWDKLKRIYFTILITILGFGLLIAVLGLIFTLILKHQT